VGQPARFPYTGAMRSWFVPALASCAVACSERAPPPPDEEFPDSAFSDGAAFDARVNDTGPVSWDATPPPVTDGYPAGPYGLLPGQIVPPLVVTGYREDGTAWESISTRDYFDPDGKKGIRGVLFVVAAQWCGVCKAQATWLPDAYRSTWKARGARILTALVQTSTGAAAVQATADQWKAAFGIPYAVAIDPKLSLVPAFGGAIALPVDLTIDPRTMRVVAATRGAEPDGALPALDAVVKANGG